MVIPQPEGLGAQEGWTSLPDGTMIRQVGDFRQTDVDEGSIYYQHESDEQESLSDSFTFEVGDTDSDSDSRWLGVGRVASFLLA